MVFSRQKTDLLIGGLGGAGPLIAVWAITLIVLAALAIWLQISYQPPLPKVGPSSVPNAGDMPSASFGDAGAGMGAKPDETASLAVSSGFANMPANMPAAEEEGLTLIRMGPVPDPALVEQTSAGPLPVISVDGRKPLNIYARPYLPNGNRPRIALVIQEIGLAREASMAAINRLPKAVSLALSPYAADPQAVLQAARDAGHEVLLMVPMEPVSFPRSDPGPHSLLVSLSAAENISRLHHVMSRAQGYAGVINHMGSRFTATPAALEPILADLSRRGLMFVDARTSARSVVPEIAGKTGLPYAENDRYIDNTATAEEIDRFLADLEIIALQRGHAVGFGRPYPVTVERIERWAKGLELKGIDLAPVTSLTGFYGPDFMGAMNE
ncbi:MULTISPECIES: divergent polysaccharide deacetylase family protein [unclassified Iodidimonas]|jgi:polysaccharide deacetylase 2 family uncharacterized protein YibQ|uniref:divergent polysaccharide deacetylase family protein n=1 Tax=unclassified Iodidimonas TaxID=2626145 RepID=UPI0024826EE9|nr:MULTISPECIES: divergent polysaccharide deacetylase family protein [unclassified Iodidimonas]